MTVPRDNEAPTPMKQSRPNNQSINSLAGGVGSDQDSSEQMMGEDETRVRECEGCGHFDEINNFCWVAWRHVSKYDVCLYGIREVSEGGP